MSLPITSCLVDGVEMISYMLLLPTRITRESGDRIGTAHLEFIGVPNSIGPYIFPGASVELLSDATTLFTGTINRIEPVAVSKSETLGGGKTNFSVDCQDLMADLAQTIVESDANYQSGASSDSTIISTLFGLYAPSIDLANVTTVSAACRIQVRAGWTLRQLMNEICGRTGAAWNLNGDTLRYSLPSATPAPWGLREYEGVESIDAGDSAMPGGAIVGAFMPGDPGTGTDLSVFIPLLNGLRFTREWTNPINRVIVRGKAGSGGVRVTSGVVEDTTSQATYGVRSRTVVEDNIQDATEAADRADVIISQNAYPQEYCSFAIRLDGLEVGQYLNVKLPSLVLDNSYYINRISLQWETQTLVTYTVECGFYRPSVIQDAKKALDDSKTPSYVTYAIPASGTVTAPSFASSIQPILIVNSLPTLPDSTYPDASVVVLTTDRKLYRNNNGTWTAAVPTSDLTGTITNTQIADDSISTPKLQANSITAAKIGAGEITSGKLAAGAVVAGTIAAGAIRASDAAFAAAAIQTADIADAAITNAKIVSLSASKITAGTIDASSITVTNLNATNITTGTLNGSRIGSGSITGSHIASATITDANIANATITSAKIVSLDASKINAGTISVGGGGITISGSGGLIMSGGAVDFGGGYYLNAAGNSSFSFLFVGGIDCNLTTGIHLSGGGPLKQSAQDVIDSSGNVIARGGFYVNNGTTYTGQTVTVVGSYTISGTPYTNLIFQGGILVSYS